MSHQVYRAQFNRPIEDAALHSLLQRAQEHYERAPGSIQLLFVEDQPTAEAQALQAAAQREVVALYREAAAREAAVIKNGGGLSFRTLTATRRRYVGPEGQPLVTSAGVSLPPPLPTQAMVQAAEQAAVLNGSVQELQVCRLNDVEIGRSPLVDCM